MVAGPLVPVGGGGQNQPPSGQSPVQHTAGTVKQDLFRAQSQHLLHQRRCGRAADEGLKQAQFPAVPAEFVDGDVPPALEGGGRLRSTEALQDLEGLLLKGQDCRLREAVHGADHVGGLQYLLGNRVEGVE